jgi:hypothetical protein
MEDALLTYRALVEPTINYGFALYMPVVSQTWLSKLRAAQNAVLHTVTRCHAAASEAHLHQECKIMPVKNHLELLCKGLLSNCMQAHHPSLKLVTAPPGPRAHLKPTLQSNGQSPILS